MSTSPTENTSNYLNIRLKHPAQPKKEPVSPQSATRISNKFENYENERQQKLQKLREEYEEKERESMIQCTKPIKRNQKSSSSTSTPKKLVKNYNSIDIYNDEEPIMDDKYSISIENSHDDIFASKTKKKSFTIDDTDSLKRNNKTPEFWDEDGSLLNTNRIQSSNSYALQNEDDFYLDLPPSPKRVEPKGKYPSLVERAINAEKSKTSDSSSINSPNSTKSHSPYSTKANSSCSTKTNSPYSKSASFREFEERQQRYREQRENQRKEAEQRIYEEANRSYTLPKSKKLYKKRIQRNGEPIRQKKNDEDEVTYTHVPDTSLSRKRIKDQPLASVVKPWDIDQNSQQQKDKGNTDNSDNSKKNTDKSFRIEDVEAYYISREVKLRSMEIEKECNKVMDCTFTPEKYTNYKTKTSSPDNPNKYIENANKQMARSRLSGQKIREEEEISKMNEAKNAQFVHKKAKIPKTTKKLMNIVNEIQKEEDIDRYNQKYDSLYDRSLATMKRRNGQQAKISINSPNKKSSDDDSEEDI